MALMILSAGVSDAGMTPHDGASSPQDPNAAVAVPPIVEGSAVKIARPDSGPGANRRRWAYIAIAAVVAVAVVVAAFAYMDMNHGSSSGTMGHVLVPAGTLYSLPADQYNAVEFAQEEPATVTATLTNVGGAQLYLMSPSQYLQLVLTYNVTGYHWTSGAIPSDTSYNLDTTVPVGSWDLVFSNSVPGNSTAIGFYTSLVETT